MALGCLLCACGAEPSPARRRGSAPPALAPTPDGAPAVSRRVASWRRARRTARPSAALRVLEVAKGRFGDVFVVQQGGRRHLRFGFRDAEDQSVFDPAHPTHEPLGYIRTSLLGLLWAPSGAQRPRTLVVGLGGGSFLRHLRRLRPRATLAAVEIDPVVVRLARRWFALGGLRSLTVHVDDGRRFLARQTARYDLILLDAYDALDYPAHLGTLEFFRLVRGRLTPGGVVVANLSPNRTRDRDALVRTFRAAFRRTRCYVTPHEGNTVVIGGGGLTLRSPAQIRRRLATLARQAPALGLPAQARAGCRFKPGAAPIRRDPRRSPPRR